MSAAWLYELPLWVSGTLILILLLLAIEFGFRLGLSIRRSNEKAADTTRGDVTVGALLALLGLLLAFTYAFSLGRADLRKQAVVHEANAIGTAFLRADLAAEPGRTMLRKRLLEYTRTRLVTYEMANTQEELRQVVQRSLQAQAELWPATRKALDGDIPGPIQASIVTAINGVLDAHTMRLAAALDHIPGVVLVLIVLVAAISLATAAHNAGLRGNISRLRMGAFAFVLAALIVVIIDFDMPLHGLIQRSNESLSALIPDIEAALSNRYTLHTAE